MTWFKLEGILQYAMTKMTLDIIIAMSSFVDLSCQWLVSHFL